MSDNDNPSNTVKLNPDGYIEITITGDQSYLSFDGLRQDIEQYSERLRVQHLPVRGLVDLSGMTGFSAGSNKAALELLEGLTYDKAALFGGSGAVAEITKLILLAIGRNDQTRVFPDKASALAWLLA